MSWSIARGALHMAEVAVEACAVIEKLTGIGGPKAEEAIKAVQSVIASVKAGFAGEMTAQEVLAQIEGLHERLAATDSAIDELAHKKFDTGGPT
jgi:hypothetical protein